MSIKYELYRTTMVGQQAQAPRYCPRPVATPVCTLDELSLSICNGTSFSESDVRGVLSALVHEIGRELSNGRHVTLPGLGTFGVALTSKQPIYDPLLVHSVHIVPSRIHFRAARSLFLAVRAARMRRSRTRRTEPEGADLRRRHILQEMVLNGFITSRKAMILNRCARKTALGDLAILVQEHKLVHYGSGNSSFYTGTSLGLQWEPEEENGGGE